ncbi:hypothetical protein [Luteimonas sp. R10]|uniref:hypothetical protein n=1 Tax=Luteimonas sp. R10 TaxID=3108176 RepID=UPI00308762DB|nr:hypothetical protein U3649_05655 [Luteimonas sp. R10]
MPRHRFLVVVLAGLIVTVGGYFLGRAKGPQPEDIDAPARSLAAPDGIAAYGEPRTGPHAAPAASGEVTPYPRPARLKDVFSALQARANAGDAAAATRLYRDLSICSRIEAIDRRVSGLADETLREPVDALAPAQLQGYRHRLDAIESNARNMQRLRLLCDGASDAMLASLVPNLRKAAELGEEHARACYLALGPNYDARGLLSHPEWLATYRDSVSSLADAGVAAGDWKVVDLLREAYRPGAEGLLAGALGADAYQHYRYLRLYRLGAEPYRIEDLDRQLAAAATRLDPLRLAEAEAWAGSVFRRNFDGGRSTGTTVPGWDPCGFPDQ